MASISHSLGPKTYTVANTVMESTVAANTDRHDPSERRRRHSDTQILEQTSSGDSPPNITHFGFSSPNVQGIDRRQSWDHTTPSMLTYHYYNHESEGHLQTSQPPSGMPSVYFGPASEQYQYLSSGKHGLQGQSNQYQNQPMEDLTVAELQGEMMQTLDRYVITEKKNKNVSLIKVYVCTGKTLSKIIHRLYQLETLFQNGSAMAAQPPPPPPYKSLQHTSCVNIEIIEPKHEIWDQLAQLKEIFEREQGQLAQATESLEARTQQLEALVHGKYSQGLLSQMTRLLENSSKLRHRVKTLNYHNSDLSSHLNYLTEKEKARNETNDSIGTLQATMDEMHNKIQQVCTSQEQTRRNHEQLREDCCKDSTLKGGIDTIHMNVIEKVEDIQSRLKSFQAVLRKSSDEHVRLDGLQDRTEEIQGVVQKLLDERESEETRITNSVIDAVSSLKESLQTSVSSPLLETADNSQWKVSELVTAAIKLALSRMDSNVDLPKLPTLSDESIQFPERSLFNTVVAAVNSIYKDVDEKVMHSQPTNSPREVSPQRSTVSPQHYGTSLENRKQNIANYGEHAGQWLRDMRTHFQYNREAVDHGNSPGRSSPTSKKLQNWFTSHAPLSTSAASLNSSAFKRDGVTSLSAGGYSSQFSDFHRNWSSSYRPYAETSGQQQAELDAIEEELSKTQEALHGHSKSEHSSHYPVNVAVDKPLSPHISEILESAHSKRSPEHVQSTTPSTSM